MTIVMLPRDHAHPLTMPHPPTESRVLLKVWAMRKGGRGTQKIADDQTQLEDESQIMGPGGHQIIGPGGHKWVGGEIALKCGNMTYLMCLTTHLLLVGRRKMGRGQCSTGQWCRR